MKHFLSSVFRPCLISTALGAAILLGSITTEAKPPAAGSGSQAPESLFVSENVIYRTHVNADATSVSTDEYTTLIKEQAAVDALSTEEIAYNSGQEEVEILEAYTILPSGERIAVGADAIRTVDAATTTNANYFSDIKKRVIIYPKVSAGSRTYMKTKTTTHTPILPETYYLHLRFAPTAEYGHVEINFSHDAKISIFVDSSGVDGGRIEDGPAGEIRYRYTFSQLGIEKTEPNQVAAIDFSPFVLFSTAPNQLALGEIVERLSAPKSAVTPKVQALADQITEGITDPKSQAKALYEWVAKNVRYVAIFVGNGGLVPHDADSIIDNRYGDCKDHNALLIALLAAKGIPATSAQVNSGSAFSVPRLGTIYPFNHVITYIPQWDLYLDSTQDLAPFGVLPTAVRDKLTTLAALGRMGRTPNLSAEENRRITHARLAVSKDGTVTGEATTQYFGNQDYAARAKFSGYVGQSRESMVRSHLGQFNEIGKGSYEPSDVYDMDTPMIVKSRFELLPMSNFPGPGAMTVPVGLAPGDLALRAYSSPRDEVRRPFTCASIYIEESYEVVFDEAIQVTRIPVNISYQNARMRYTATYERNGPKVIVKRALRSQQPGRVCQPEDLIAYRELHKVNRRDILSQIFYE